VQQAVQLGTTYSQSNSSPIWGAASWRENVEVDLVANLGSRERTRQELLFEIVSSEERSDNPSHPSILNVADEPQICDRVVQDEGDIHRPASAFIRYGFVLAFKILRVLRKPPNCLPVPCFACCWPIDNPSAAIDKVERNSLSINIRR